MTDRELLEEVLESLVSGTYLDQADAAETIMDRLAQPEREETLLRQINFLTEYNDILQKANVMAFKNERQVLETMIAMRESMKPLTDKQIEEVRQRIFPTDNPYTSVENQAMLKMSRAIEAAHGIGEQND